MKKIIVIDDDIEIQQLLMRVLSEDYEVHVESTLKAATNLVRSHRFDLIILDSDLPDGNGIHLCPFIRKEIGSEIPIIMLTKKPELSNKLQAFDFGADDYITKPFEPLELKARIKSRLKTSKEMKTEQYADLTFHLSSGQVSIARADGVEHLILTPTEYKLLHSLVKNEDQTFSRDQLLKMVWGQDIHVRHRTIDQHIANLRKKVANGKYKLKSARNLGYYATKADKKTRTAE